MFVGEGAAEVTTLPLQDAIVCLNV